jgi:cytochrome P450
MQPTNENAARGSAMVAFDPFELPDTLQLGTTDDPYPYFAEARRRAPVQANWPLPYDVGTAATGDPAQQSFCVLGHDEVVAALRDHETFSSTVLAEIMEPMLGHTIIAMDEPEHRTHRALVAPAFRLRLLARWQDELVASVVDELLDAIVPLGRADLVRQLTFAFPVRVIARILGLPQRDAAQFQRWSIELISTIVDWDRGIAASHALGDYFAEQVTQRRSHPTDDLISELIETELDGERLSDEDIFAFLRLLLPAGVETTYRSFGNLLFALLTHPEQLDEVVHDPQLRGAAIEVALRRETPLLIIPRRCTRDTQLGGVDIPAGREVNIFLAAANRDERRYPDPDRFDIHRSPTPHVSFGSGPHMCLGVHLARMETRVALDATLERLRDLRLDSTQPPPAMVGSLLRSPDSLPVVFEASATR